MPYGTQLTDHGLTNRVLQHCCQTAGRADGDQQSNLTDAVFLLLYLFNNGAPPALGTECLRLADCPDACAP